MSLGNTQLQTMAETGYVEPDDNPIEDYGEGYYVSMVKAATELYICKLIYQ